MELAPIIIFTFNRLEHTIKTIESLKENQLADKSEVFIFSDGPRNENEIQKVNEVRKYIKSIKGFKKVTVYEYTQNNGLANSVISGVTKIINKYKKVIVLEDDLITSKFFIRYMNEALCKYEKRKDIWSVSGYSPNINIPNTYKDEVYLIRRGASWGWATWQDRWQLNDWDIIDYEEFRKNRKRKKEFNEVGSDITPMLNDQMEGRINSWAVRWVYNQFRNNMWTVYPIKSFINNIGTDLSGTHSSNTNKYEVKMIEGTVKINPNILINKEICNNFKQFYDLNLSGYLAILIKKLGLYKPARRIRNRILLKVREN